MLMQAVADKRNDVIWHAIEFRGECLPELDAIPTCQVAVQGSFQAVPADPRYAVVLTKPPCRSALAFAQHALKFSSVVLFLLRLNWLASAKHASWIRRHLQHLYVLPDLLSCVGDSSDATDPVDYGWFLFRHPEDVSLPTITILATTPASERANRTARTRGQRDLFDQKENDNGGRAEETDAESAGESSQDA
jgi:hypothetical protein